ncbi:MAG: M56 family metallopeptidase [Saprospiraceae bacterium]
MNTIVIIPESITNALGWVLVHSLWQFTALALVVLALRPRMKTARQRFYLAYSALLGGFITAIGTFFWVYEPGSTSLVNNAILIDYNRSAVPFEATLSGWQDQLVLTLERYNPLIVSCWLLGLAFFTLRLAGAWWWINRLRRHGLKVASEATHAALERLKVTAGFKKPIGIGLSRHIKSPLTLGHLKPLVLFPIAVINQLSLEETEAILAHELAHIMRHDWLLNLIQSCIEALFYFHPASWWLSSMARTERENCCDDLAVALTGNPLGYAKALLKVQQISQEQENKTPALALGFAGKSGFWGKHPKLLHRIQRLLQPQQQKIALMEKLTATILLLGFITLLGIQTQTNPLISPLQAMVPDLNFWQAAQDTLPPGTESRQVQKIKHDDGNQVVELELENDEIKELKVDGNVIAPSAYGEYEELITEIRELAPPAPPTPPTPPSGVRGVRPPHPPAPPAPLNTITTDQDDQGNTRIRIRQSGDPVEIIVKDGVVTMNGKPLPEGEIQTLPGNGGSLHFWSNGEGTSFQFPENGNFRFFSNEDVLKAFPNGNIFEFDFDGDHVFEVAPDGQLFQFKSGGDHEIHVAPDGNILLFDSKEFSEDIEKEIRIATELQAREMERANIRVEREMRDVERQHQRLERDHEAKLQRAERELARARVTQDREIARARSNYERALETHSRRNQNFSDYLGEELLQDGFIKNPEKFKFQISSDQMRVNGKKMTGETHRKYLRLYERKTGNKIGPKDEIKIHINN